MRSSDSINELAPALVAAQRTIKNPKTDSEATVQTKAGGSYGYKYLSLPALLETVRSVFKDVGLIFVQELTSEPHGIGCITRIIHLSGQWIETGPFVLPAAGTPQEHGSAATYARRYALAAAIGLAAEEDDDAQSARPARRATPVPVAAPAVAPPSADGNGASAERGEQAGMAVAPLSRSASQPIAWKRYTTALTARGASTRQDLKAVRDLYVRPYCSERGLDFPPSQGWPAERLDAISELLEPKAVA